MTERISSLEHLEAWTSTFLEDLTLLSHARIITLRGDLGAGKTAFTKACARAFGVEEDITSPTFVIQKEYDIKNDERFTRMIHIDAYRLEGKEQLEYLGWDTLITDPQTIIFLEWPEMVAGIELPEAINITLSINEDHTRTVAVDK